ncbi:uncharacterized protein Smp_200570 [Schistosoma mansoni]|uniref:Smp_200570 n=1 Tax=Schistosoma mansoni TaxID=6183 RepID=G4V7E0_SCHMA|nr:uncharacterized protein Smp_200570 [Schistosoma mansoni]|eukprot:XP_018648809.1 uncharacterized protein Smp_200570 [Schistosoma mansoni]
MKSTFQLHKYYEESFLPGCKNEFDLNSSVDNIEFTVYNYLGHDILVCRNPFLTEHHSSNLKNDDKINLLYDSKTTLEGGRHETTGQPYDYKPQKVHCSPHFCHHAQFHPSKCTFVYPKIKVNVENLHVYPGLKWSVNKTQKITRQTAVRSTNVIPITSFIGGIF